MSEPDELTEHHRLAFVRRAALFGLGLQLLAWGVCWLWLYDPVPTFKVIASDYPDVRQSDGFRRMVELSEQIVIATGSDARYATAGVAFLVMCGLCNAGVITTARRRRALGIWTGISTLLPVVFLGCLLFASRSFVHDLIVTHPEIADAPIPWIGVFR